MSTARPAIFAGLTLAIAAFAACGDRKGGFEAPPSPADVLGGTDAALDDGATCALSCSPDLRTVRDCNGREVERCPDTLGCAPGGRCVAPCEASAENKSTLGCEFWAHPPAGRTPLHSLDAGRGHCFAVLVVNAWSRPAKLELELDGTRFDAARHARILGQGASLSPLPNDELPPGALGAIFLHARSPAADSDAGAGEDGGGDAESDVTIEHAPCPQGVTAAVVDRQIATFAEATDTIRSFRVGSDVPIAAYTLYPFGGAKAYITSASLLLPTSAWGTNYMLSGGIDSAYGSFSQILAHADDTHVTIRPRGVLLGNEVLPSADPTKPATYTLRRGQVLQFVQPQLSGGALESDKPVGIWGGDYCTNIGTSACDSLHQQIVPVGQLGSEYVAVPHSARRGKPEAPRWRMMAAVDGTKLTFDPEIAAATLGSLHLAARDMATFIENKPFVVRSQDEAHPFYAWGYMTGGADHEGDGDPDFYNLVPTGQFLPSYRFYTDPTYGNTELLFVRKGKTSVKLECLGEVTGWEPVGTSAYELARVRISNGGAPTGTCRDGAHYAFADAPFGLTVVGYDRYASYMFPAGMSSKVINAVRVPVEPR